jgi:hypothetical protein
MRAASYYFYFRENLLMKYIQYLSLLGTAALALSMTAFAADTHSGNFTLSDRVEVGSMQLAPGNYKAEWSGPSNALKVDIMQHGKTVATANGRVKNLEKPSPYSSVTLKPATNSEKTIDEIDFNHRTEAIVLSGE